MVTINIQKKDLWLLSAIMIFLIGITYIIAYNPTGTGGTPSVMGHSADEIEGGGGGETYDSGWFACTPGGTYVINHNLNSDKVIFQVLFSTSSSGSNAVTQYASHDHSHGDFSHAIGAMVKPTSLNSCTVQAGNSYAGYIFSSSGAGTKTASGYYRLLAIKS